MKIGNSHLPSFLAFVLFHTTLTAVATNYYVDPSYSGGGPNGSFAKPWKNLSSVNSNMWAFVGGDTVFFKRGQHFSGTLDIYSSGTSTNPLVFMPYGTGAAPVIEYALPDATTPINRNIIAISNNRYVVVDGFTLTDATISDAGHSSTANIGRAAYIYLGKHITLKNLYVERVGIGITVQGDSNLVQQCTITNLREIVNTASPSNDDYGAVGILISGSYNNILNNIITECWAPSYDYSYDGGAMELTGGASENQIFYNTAINNDGWTQIDTEWSTQTESNNVMGYNLLINNGRIFWFNFGGTLTVQGFKFYNNDIVETVMQHSNYPYMLGCDAAPFNANALLLKNNIFWINTAIDISYTVTKPFAGAQMVHQNNLYHLTGGSLGYTIDASETALASGTSVFTNTSSADPSIWDYHIPAGSSALDYGQYLSLTKDFDGITVFSGAAPEAGILETVFGPVLVNENFVFSVRKKLHNNALQWSISNDLSPEKFVVEKSFNGVDFRAIADMPAAITGGTYGYVDGSAETKNYYRIAALLSNHQIVRSRVISTDAFDYHFSLFPNPACKDFTLRSSGDDLYNGIISISTVNGARVKQILMKEHRNSVTISLAELKDGLYYASYENPASGLKYSRMLIKK
jgi:hypothetical protein